MRLEFVLLLNLSLLREMIQKGQISAEKLDFYLTGIFNDFKVNEVLTPFLDQLVTYVHNFQRAGGKKLCLKSV